MKTINFFKTALLTIALFVCGNVWGETATSNFLSSKTTDAQIVENSKPITYKCSSKNDYENPARIYKNSTLTISSTDNSIITKIELSGPNSHPLTNFTCETGDYQAETTNATWTGEATSVIFNASVGQTRVQSIIVTYTPATAASVATPTFSVQTGKYTEAQSVTIDCATAEASIYYTLDETEPSAESTPYSEAINISSTTTLKAVAVKNGESSAVASATYTFPTEVNSIEAFYELSDDTFAKITGNLTIVFVNGSSVYMQDASGSLLVYDNNLASTEGLTNGTVISNIVGTKTNYNGASQMQNILSHSIVGNGSVINPTTVTGLTVADVHKYVKLEDAQFDNTYSFTESSSPINANLSTHGNIVVRNNFRNFTMDVNSTDKYDIIGFVSVYNSAPQIYPVSITITTPSFMISTDALNFDEVGRNQTKTLEFTLQGVNLTEDVTLNLSGTNAGYFEYTPQSISVNEDGSIEETTISVTYKPTELGNNHTATLTITSSGLNKTITLQGSCIKTVLPTPVATEATAITANGFTANWEAVDNATSYEVNVWTEEEPAFSVANSSFENDLENWEAEEGYSLSTNNAHTGSQSLAFDVKATKDLRQTIENLTPGEEITLSYWYYLNETSTGSGLRFWCYWVGDDDHSALQPDTYTNEKGAWTQATITTTVPEGATALNLEIRVYNGANGYIDDITVTPANGNTITPITGSPFTVEGATTSKEITGLTAETTYYYNVVAKAEGYTASEASNTISVTTTAEVAEPTITITGDDLVETEGRYTVALGETRFSTRTSKTFTLTATGILEPIKIKPEMGSGYFTIISSDSEQASIVEEMDFFGNVNKTLTFTPNETGEINAVCTISNRTDSEFADYGISNGEEMLQMFDLTFGTPLTEQWGILYQNQTANITKVITVSLTPTEESTGTGLCNQPEMEGITFNGEEIINSLNLDVVVYNAVGQMVVRSNENINMSSYPAGVYVIKAANRASMKIVK